MSTHHGVYVSRAVAAIILAFATDASLDFFMYLLASTGDSQADSYNLSSCYYHTYRVLAQSAILK